MNTSSYQISESSMPGSGGKYLWVKHFVKRNPTKTYKEVCGFARDTEMIVRTLLYDYSDDIKRFGDRKLAN